MLASLYIKIAMFAANILHQKEILNTTRQHSGAVTAKCLCVKRIEVTLILAVIKAAWWNI
jgi:hypothetical protein